MNTPPPEDAPTFDETAKKLGFTTMSDVLGRDYPLHLVRGLLPQVGTTCAYGAPGLGKSFMALDIALSIAAGCEVFGRKTLQGSSFYLSTEGKTGTRARAEAWAAARGHELVGLPIALHEEPMNLRDSGIAGNLMGRLKTLEDLSGVKCRFICIDTLSQCLFGDENRQEEVVEFCRAMTRLANELEAQVCVIHHTGKDESKGARGSSVINGNFDTLLHLSENDGPRDLTLRAGKQKNGAKLGVRLLLDEHICGTDADGEVVSSLAVSLRSGDVMSDEPNGGQPKVGPLSPAAQTVFGIVQAAGDAGLDSTELRLLAQQAGVGPKRPATAREIVDRLVAQGKVRENDAGKLVAA